MPIPLLAGAAIGGVIGGVGSLFGGPKDPLRPESRQHFDQNIRGFGQAGQRAITGFDPTTGEFGLPSGPFAGPLALGFDNESINEFNDPFIAQLLEQLQLKRERALGEGDRNVSSLAARTGSTRGSRRAVLDVEGSRSINERFDIADLMAQIESRAQSADFALRGLPFNNAALETNQNLRRFGIGMEAAEFARGTGAESLTAEAATGVKKPNVLSGIIGGAITGAGAVGGGGGAGVIPLGAASVAQPRFPDQDLFAGAQFGLPNRR